jgi:outer membrane receptor for ferrienterochelin and colicins
MSLKNFIILGLIVLYSSNINANNSTSGNIQILQKGIDQPIQYAHVMWKDATYPKISGSEISDTKGNIRIQNHKSNQIIISISCIGFKSLQDTISLNETKIIYLDEDVFNLDQVTVTGTRTPHTLNKAPILTQVITSKEIENIDATNALEILEIEIPGIEISQAGYGPSLNMQGLGANYTLILVDGERMAGETDGNVDYYKINSGNIDRIELVRGASSTLYGSSAMGGVINIITKKPKKAFEFKIDVKYGQNNQKNYSSSFLEREDDGDLRLYYKNHDLPNLVGNLNLGFRKGGFYSNTYLNAKTSDGYQLTDSKSIKKHYTNRDTIIYDNEYLNKVSSSVNGYFDYSISQKIGFDNNGKWKHELNGNYYQHEEYDFDNNGKHNFNKSFTISEKTSYSLSETQSFHFSTNYDKYQKFDANDKSESKNNVYNQSFNNIKLNYVAQIREKHNLLIGIENLYEELGSDMFDSTETMIKKYANNFVVILQDEFNITDKFTIIAGLRNGWHSAYNHNITPTISTKYSLSSFNFRLSYARGYRSPSLKELYMNWDHLGMFEIVGDPNMKPEQNNYYSFSTDYKNISKHLNLTFISSYNQIFNKIEGYWSGSNQDIYYYSNIGEQSVLSFEGILKWKFLNRFLLKGGYIYLNILESNNTVQTSVISPHSFTSQLAYNYKKESYELNLNISGKIMGKKTFEVLASDDEIFPGEYYEVDYPMYSIWNIALNQKYSRYKINIEVKNLFNYKAPIVNFNTSTNPGRKFYVSIGYSF